MINNYFTYHQVQQIAQAAQQLQQLQKAQQQHQNNQQSNQAGNQHQHHQHNTSLPPNNNQNNQITLTNTQTTPPNNTGPGHINNLPASLLTPSTPSSGGLTPQHLKTPSRLLEPSPEETTDLEELEQFAKTFKQRRIKLGEPNNTFLSSLNI